MHCLQGFCRGNQENGDISAVQELQEAQSVRRHLDEVFRNENVKRVSVLQKKSRSITIDNKVSQYCVKVQYLE